MKMKRYIALSIALLMAIAASAQIKRIAILETIDKEDKVPYAIEVMVRSNLTKVISNAPGYEGYDRVNISQIMDEHDFERTGLVSEEQIRRLGEISGADYILVSEAVKFDESNIFVTAKILNVESAKTESSENALMGMTAPDIQHGCESLANRLLGIPDPYQEKQIAEKPKATIEQKPKEEVTNPNPIVEKPVTISGNQAKIGEIIDFPDGSRGVIFYLDENGRGLSVSLNEGEEVWDKSRRLNDIASIANLDENESNFIYGAGLSQTQALIFASGDDARAAYWCTMQGEGWYLPSCGELLTLINMSKEGSPVANTLRLLNVGTIDGWYWSSSEHDKKEALNVSSTGRVSTEEKKEKVKVRAIKTFTIK